MGVQIAEPQNARLFPPQVVIEVRFEFVVSRAAAVGVLRLGSGRRAVRHLEAVAADEAEERHGKFKSSVLVREPDDIRKHAVRQHQCFFHARCTCK